MLARGALLGRRAELRDHAEEAVQRVVETAQRLAVGVDEARVVAAVMGQQAVGRLVVHPRQVHRRAGDGHGQVLAGVPEIRLVDLHQLAGKVGAKHRGFPLLHLEEVEATTLTRVAP